MKYAISILSVCMVFLTLCLVVGKGIDNQREAIVFERGYVHFFQYGHDASLYIGKAYAFHVSF